jgi:uncharacterized heparinase superfamily protein
VPDASAARVLAVRLRRVLAKPPGYIARRVAREVREEIDRWFVPGRMGRFAAPALLNALGCGSVGQLWEELLARPYPFFAGALDAHSYGELAGTGDADRILAAAERALRHEVDLLGSGPIALGATIDWHKDFKSGLTFAPGYFRDIDYARLDEPCDVKVPWELSRLQWLIPAGQAWLLTADERFAAGCREVLEQWISANPCALSVNWACTMEAAMRIFTWSWLFRVCGRSQAWAEEGFRARFLTSLYLHGEFTERYIERGDVNGNHFTADAAALVFAGLLFGAGEAPQRWVRNGWQELCTEAGRQVFSDGVDFEASVPYHRLVEELLLFAAMYRRACGLDVPADYEARLRAMARYTSAYCRPDGTSPNWGDNDDARVLPCGGQPAADHRYLVQIAAHFLGDEQLGDSAAGDHSELFWICGPAAVRTRASAHRQHSPPTSAAFRDGGFYIMRNATDHVFIDCGPLGLAGRGGHGHNDLLSFEAVLAGVPLITDSGCYLYTASPLERDSFRSTAYHSTPQVDGQEINRFLGPNFLWNLHDDARFEVRTWRSTSERDEFCGAHFGYQRLADPVSVERRIVLEHPAHALTVTDRLTGRTTHAVNIPYHLAPGLQVEGAAGNSLRLLAGSSVFCMRWQGAAAWSVAIEAGRCAPAYGVTTPRAVVVFSCAQVLPQELTVELRPWE